MSSERTARFTISLFGRFQLIGRGGPIELTSKKHAALLAYLAATHPGAHSRARTCAKPCRTCVKSSARAK
jgi:hypothetical protein